jgi:hydroxymethylpyrimidine pyrophosphatase-like HAD family hydrolase
MVVTDLDGTLLQNNRKISPRDYDTLLLLGRKSILRVIATGRSLYSSRGVLPDDLPIDCLLFSSGAGIVDWTAKKILMKYSLTPAEVRAVVEFLMKLGADFMVHEPIPDNHFFVYYRTGRFNPDFSRRCELYKEFASELDFTGFTYRSACQVLAIEPSGTGSVRIPRIARALHWLKVIRTTSPLDKRSIWVEIFPAGVSKAHAAGWICDRNALDRKKVLGIGNDYNDVDLLAWVGTGMLVGNAPADLKKQFRAVSSNDENGFSEAVHIWLKYSNL